MARAQGSLRKSLLGLVVLALAYAARSFGLLPFEQAPANDVAEAPTQIEQPASSAEAESGQKTTLSSGVKRLEQAFQHGESDVIVEAEGSVERLLADDNEGSRHQKFIVRLATGRTLLISHNIDLAPRVPIREGDEVEFKGEYEWSDRGGVLHWTHHDPKGWHDDGWIRHNGKNYR